MHYDIAFLGGIFPKEKEDEIINNEKGNIQNAANILQWNYINGLDYYNDSVVKIINALFIGSYPHLNKKLFIKKYKFAHKDEADDINTNFINIKYYKNISRFLNCYKELKKWARIESGTEKLIFIYSLHSPFLSAAYKIKKLYSNIKIVGIVPDLPEYMSLSNRNTHLYNFLKRIDEKIILEKIKIFDYFVLLTNYMAEKLNIIKNYVVVEGMFDINNLSVVTEKSDNNYFDIVYTGTLNEKYGILNVVNAVQSLKNLNCRLIICGEGEAKDKIINLGKIDNRIIYKGLLKRDDIIKIQQNADLLVNIRPTSEEYTKYSFPSKIMEYMASGTPLLTTDLRGMPSEYKDYVYIVEDESINGIANKLIELMNDSKHNLMEKGKKAREFILREKNNIIQVKKVIDMITTKNV